MNRRVWLRILLPLAVLGAIFWYWPREKRSPSTASFYPETKRFAGLRFDPAYFYDRGQTARELAAELVARWQAAGLNAVLFRRVRSCRLKVCTTMAGDDDAKDLDGIGVWGGAGGGVCRMLEAG